MKHVVHQTLLGIIITLTIQSGLIAGEGPALYSAKQAGDQYYAILGAVGNPGVYEFKKQSPHVSDLINRSGDLNSKVSTVHLVRNGRPGITFNYSASNDPVLLKGDIIFLPGKISDPNKVQITLLNLLPRPVVLHMKKEDSNINFLLKMLGQSPESVKLVKAQGYRGTTGKVSENLTTGSILVFKPSLVAKKLIPPLPAFYAFESKKLSQSQIVKKQIPVQIQLKQKAKPIISVLPVPVQDPEVGVVNVDGTIKFPPSDPTVLDLDAPVAPLLPKKQFRASSRISNKKNPTRPVLAAPFPKKETVKKAIVEASSAVPPPPVESKNIISRSSTSANSENIASSSPFKITSTLIISIMFGAVLITSMLLGSMATGSSDEKNESSSRSIDFRKELAVQDELTLKEKQVVREQQVTRERAVRDITQPVPQPQVVSRNSRSVNTSGQFDLEALIQDELVIIEIDPEFVNLENIYGTPAGPRMIRVESRQKFKAPHYMREVRGKNTGQKESVMASVETPSSNAQANVEAKIASQMNQAEQQISNKIPKPKSKNMTNPDRSKRVKLEKPTIEMSIEQKLGMLDQVLSSVQKPNQN